MINVSQETFESSFKKKLKQTKNHEESGRERDRERKKRDIVAFFILSHK